MPPLPLDIVALVNQREKAAGASRVRAGYPAHGIEFPCFQLYGPIEPVIDAHGAVIDYTCRRHPRGPGRPCRTPPDFADYDLPDEILSDIVEAAEIAI